MGIEELNTELEATPMPEKQQGFNQEVLTPMSQASTAASTTASPKAKEFKIFSDSEDEKPMAMSITVPTGKRMLNREELAALGMQSLGHIKRYQISNSGFRSLPGRKVPKAETRKVRSNPETKGDLDLSRLPRVAEREVELTDRQVYLEKTRRSSEWQEFLCRNLFYIGLTLFCVYCVVEWYFHTHTPTELEKQDGIFTFLVNSFFSLFNIGELTPEEQEVLMYLSYSFWPAVFLLWFLS